MKKLWLLLWACSASLAITVGDRELKNLRVAGKNIWGLDPATGAFRLITRNGDKLSPDNAVVLEELAFLYGWYRDNRNFQHPFADFVLKLQAKAAKESAELSGSPETQLTKSEHAVTSPERPVNRTNEPSQCDPAAAGKAVTLTGTIRKRKTGSEGTTPFILASDDGAEYDLPHTRYQKTGGALGEGDRVQVSSLAYRAPTKEGRCRFFLDHHTAAGSGAEFKMVEEGRGKEIYAEALPSTEFSKNKFTTFVLDDSKASEPIPGIKSYLRTLAFRAGAIHAYYVEDRLSEGKHKGSFMPSIRLPSEISERQYCENLHRLDTLHLITKCGR